MIRVLPRLLLAAALPLAVAAAAQTPPEPREPGAPAEDLTEAAPQISSPRDKALVEEQVSRAGGALQLVTQVAPAARSAQAPQSLSTPIDGRTGTVAAVDGKDRCDPHASRDKRVKICSDVIESRAGEFQRAPRGELSPEQRLLLTRQLEGAGKTVADATRRLADTGSAGDSTESMGIASIVLSEPKPTAPANPPKPEKLIDPSIDAATQAIIQSILAPR